MNRKKDGGPAYPRAASSYHGPQDGVSVWDYFATRAPVTFQGLIEILEKGDAKDMELGELIKHVASVHAAYADAMIAEREKRRGEGGKK